MYVDEEFQKAVSTIGEFRNRNTNCFIIIDDTPYTWSELGGDLRIAEWLYGMFVLYIMDSPKDSFTDYVTETLKNTIQIKDWLQENYTLPETCEYKTWTYLADKCAKTISFGAPFIQVKRYVEKTLKFLETHPRGADGKRGRWDE